MRLVVFNDYRIGVLAKDSVHEVSAVVPRWESGDLHAMNRLIAQWDRLKPQVEAKAKESAGVPLASVTLRAPVPAPTHVFAAPANYRAHSEEMRSGSAGVPVSKGPHKTADELGFFMKATGSITGPSEPIALPLKWFPTRRFDHEGEIAFVIGKTARGVAPERALDYIFGYTMMIDATMRVSTDRAEERVQRKSFASFSPMGPYLVTADEIPWRELAVALYLNGEKRQEARAPDMIVDVPNLLARASQILPLLPGDLYTTGSPAGVSPITVGDKVVVDGGKLGRMELAVVERDW